MFYDAQDKLIDFLAMVERLYLENYFLRGILKAKQPDGSLPIPDWESQLQESLSNKLLADEVHRRLFAPLFDRLRQASQAEAVDEVLRSIERANPEN